MVIRRLRPVLLSIRGAVVALVLLDAIVPSSHASGAGPFVDFDWTDHVTTSRDGYTMWARLPSRSYTGILPPHSDPVGPGARPVVLQVHCRAPSFEASSPISPTPTHALLYLDDHPLQPDAYTVFHPMYWILGLAGRSLERWPATARLGDTGPVATELVRRRTEMMSSKAFKNTSTSSTRLQCTGPAPSCPQPASSGMTRSMNSASDGTPVAQPADRAIDLPRAVRVTTCWRGEACRTSTNGSEWRRSSTRRGPRPE